jgi:hypothetical protein
MKANVTANFSAARYWSGVPPSLRKERLMGSYAEVGVPVALSIEHFSDILARHVEVRFPLDLRHNVLGNGHPPLR